MDFTLYWFMFPVSIVVATCAMLSGIGGAALFTPIFILVFPLLGPEYVLESTVAAIAAALFTQSFGFLSGFIGYYRRGLIDYGLAWTIIRVSVPVAILGALTASLVHESVLLASYSLLVAVLAIVMWWNPVPKEERQINQGITAIGAFLTGMVSVGIGEVTISQLTRNGVAIGVAAATSVLVVIATIVTATSMLFTQLIQSGGWTAVPWNLLVYDIPGVLIGGQIGPRLQGKVSPHTMRRAISILFVILAIAMLAVAARKAGLN